MNTPPASASLSRSEPSQTPPSTRASTSAASSSSRNRSAGGDGPAPPRKEASAVRRRRSSAVGDVAHRGTTADALGTQLSTTQWAFSPAPSFQLQEEHLRPDAGSLAREQSDLEEPHATTRRPCRATSSSSIGRDDGVLARQPGLLSARRAGWGRRAPTPSRFSRATAVWMNRTATRRASDASGASTSRSGSWAVALRRCSGGSLSARARGRARLRRRRLLADPQARRRRSRRDAISVEPFRERGSQPLGRSHSPVSSLWLVLMAVPSSGSGSGPGVIPQAGSPDV